MTEIELVRIQFVELLFNATRSGQADLPLGRLPEWLASHEYPVLITRIDRVSARPVNS